jgi:hypothetical protein
MNAADGGLIVDIEVPFSPEKVEESGCTLVT